MWFYKILYLKFNEEKKLGINSNIINDNEKKLVSINQNIKKLKKNIKKIEKVSYKMILISLI